MTAGKLVATLRLKLHKMLVHVKRQFSFPDKVSAKFEDWILISSLNYIVSNKIQNVCKNPSPARKEQNRKT